jgi:hypothetical protein
MTYTGQTPLLGTSRGNALRITEWAIARGAQRTADLSLYLATVYRLAPTLGLNADVVAAQSHLETAGWTSYWWIQRCNPAGMGITGDADENAASRDFGNGENAAEGHLAHLGLYAGVTVPPALQAEDPRWQAAIDAGYYGIADVLEDLTMRWAWDGVEPDDPATYGDKIASRMNLMEAAGLLPAPKRRGRKHR